MSLKRHPVFLVKKNIISLAGLGPVLVQVYILQCVNVFSALVLSQRRKEIRFIYLSYNFLSSLFISSQCVVRADTEEY